jgi:hypothetical protein
MTYATLFPKDAVEFLRTKTLPARIYNVYDWGGYLQYWLPERKVFIDGRANTVLIRFSHPEPRSIKHLPHGVDPAANVSLSLWLNSGEDLAPLLPRAVCS